MHSVRALALAAVLAVVAAGCQKSAPKLPLISARTTMVTAWEVPRNPLTDKTLDETPLAQQIRWGYRIFVDTPHEAGTLVQSRMTCANCHLNSGQRERALPLVGLAGMFPEYNKRAARLFTLSDRIVDCFVRSENGPPPTARDDADRGAAGANDETPRPEHRVATPASKEVLAVTAYLTWLSDGAAVGRNPSWRGRNTIEPSHLVPVAQLDVRRGESLFMERCTSCHGVDGQGVQIGDKKAGPLWGPNSWNDGAGAARIYTLAGIIRYTMPYLDPGSLSDDEAQTIAAFIDSKPRPVYPFKSVDYGGKPPVDAVYYAQRATQTAQRSAK